MLLDLCAPLTLSGRTDPLEAVAVCEDGVVLERGRLIECGDLRMLLSAELPTSYTLRAFRAQLGNLQALE